MMTTASPKVLTQIIQDIAKIHDGIWRINHKRCWLEYLKSGELPFTPSQLHNVVNQVVNLPQNRPRGEKLFQFRQKYNFTIKTDKLPYRTEEALERFIVIANDKDVYNQVPIGGGKESIDLVVQRGQSVEFVELKAWKSGDSPLYALVEGLKNLIEYRVIDEHKIENIKMYPRTEVSVLAPVSYYQDFRLLDGEGQPRPEDVNKATRLLQELGKEFNAVLSFKYLTLPVDEFNESCTEIFTRNQASGQCSVDVTELDVLDPLRHENWIELVSSEEL